MATTLEIDAVIDPADTRAWLVRGIDGTAPGMSRSGGDGARFVDVW
jgi:acetyl-CoA carboxylase carboxyltransferase component